MSAASRTGGAALPLPLARQVESAYQRFESAWRAGQRPAIEEYLRDLPEPARAALFPELLALELSGRRRAGEVVRPEEYRQRFPEHAALIGPVFQETVGGDPLAWPGKAPSATGELGDEGALPTHLGRYRVTARLGAGGFGVVYKAHDDDLGRDVAVKVPHRHRIATAADIEAYLAEARMLATLDHPGIVPVHDVGRTADGLCYVVSKFVAGQDLRARLRQTKPSCAEAAALVAQVAEALHHAHRRGLVHRDVKPANILLDEQGRPVVADFGLALRDVDFGTGPQLAGTPAYMSPEQARGEGHRVDARTDVYSLGVVFYELLTGQRPYRSERPEDVLEEVKAHEPRPPRQLDEFVPPELDRICLRALAKRASDRYSTAGDLAEDLRHWLGGEATLAAVPARAGVVSGGVVSGEAPATPLTTHHSPLTTRVVPRGLRAYDAADADFFLELLPGPRDRDGLPESLRFWKRRIDETDADQTFSVGLLYGPSGCGKSSLVKAGLLPRLAPHVRAVYVEATPDETEVRLLKGLRKRCPELPNGLGLIDTLAELRRRGARRDGARRDGVTTSGSKVLLVLDQFEQWLHGTGAEQQTELVRALRQCDGEHVQGLVLVRDDFGMAAARFMNELEVRIVQGHNFATVDLFDPNHARKVLAEFGRSFGQLPAAPAAPAPEQERFLDEAVAGLAQGGQVISVRLALFAEMVKGKPWTPATLRRVGGTEGVGVTFLEETFSAATAPPPHRLHQKAARAVLKALLPEPGADLKGHMRPHQELREAAGYSGRPREFVELLHILDTELRLVTPTDPEGAFDEGPTAARAAGPSYQLTHDYLVPALRQWLTRKQRETRQGRTELLLAERVSFWSAKQDSRQLPGWWEWSNILLWTRAKDRTPAQRRMLRAATRRHLLQAAVLLLTAAMFGWGLWEIYRGPVRADNLVRALASADIQGVEQIIDELATCRPWADPKLRALALESSSPKERLNASLALLPDPGRVDYLEERLLEVGEGRELRPEEALVITQRLRESDPRLEVAARLAAKLRALLESERVPPPRRFRAACALAVLQPGQHWERWSGEVVKELARKDPDSAKKWVRLPMEGNGPVLYPALKKVFQDPDRPESVRAHVAALVQYTFATYSISSAKELMEVILAVEGEPYTVLSDWFIGSGHEAAALVRGELDRPSPADPRAVDALARRQAHAAVALLQLEDWDRERGPLDRTEHIRADRLWPLLQSSAEPRLLSLRSYLSHRFVRAGVKAEVLLEKYAAQGKAEVLLEAYAAQGSVSAFQGWCYAAYAAQGSVSARRALLWGLGEYKDYQLPADAWKPLLRDYRDDPDPGVHSALDRLLRQWKQDPRVEEIDDALAGRVEANRRWYVTTRKRHTLAVIPRPAEFKMGSPGDEPHRRLDETLHDRPIPQSFAIATKEVTVRQFREFLQAYPDAGRGWELTRTNSLHSDADDVPVVGVTWFAAAQYCRWLSEQEGIPENERCYPSVPDIKDGMRLPAGYLARTGYRLPTEAEWEYACRAGAVTSRPYGSGDALLDHHAWNAHNSNRRPGRVGSLKPNDLGLFDMLGNAWEWCADPFEPNAAGPEEPSEPVLAANQRVLRGGGFLSGTPELRSAHRFGFHPHMPFNQAGLRVARTWR